MPAVDGGAAMRDQAHRNRASVRKIWLERLLVLPILFSFASSLFAEEQTASLPVFPPPRQVQLLAPWTMQLPLAVEAPPALQSPANLLRRELMGVFGADAVADRGKTPIALRLDRRNLRREEEYTVDASSDGIVIRARDVLGAFWGVHSLMQVLTSDVITLTPKGWRVQGFRLRDHPESNFRAFMVQAAWTDNLEALRKALDVLAQCKVRYVAIEFGAQVVLDFDPSIARGARFSKSQAKAVVEYARSLGMEPIGYLNMLAHLERAYEKLPYTAHGGIVVQNAEVYEKFVFPILSEMLEVFGPVKWFHCGMDEANELFEWFTAQGYDSARLLADHIRKVNDFLKAKGVRLVIWHDMLVSPELQQQLGVPIGSINGGPPQNTAKAIDLLPKDVILNYWFYDPYEAYPALDWLRSKGFKVWASPWQTPFSLVRYAQARNVPTIGTIWADLPHYSSSHSMASAFALYAWASWNPASAPSVLIPERDIAPIALKATQSILWHRRQLAFPTSSATILRNDGNTMRLSIPAQVDKAPHQHYGVPFDFSSPYRTPSLKRDTNPSADPSQAQFVLLPGGTRVRLDGVNRDRGEDELILYTAPLTTTRTNIYGVEVAISATGEVGDRTDYGSGNMPIPAGGIVLSAHIGPKAEKANALRKLQPGERISLLSADGRVIAGYRGILLKASLPDGVNLTIDGVNRNRGEDELILYLPDMGSSKTGTNPQGVEVVVEGGKVVAVRDRAGDTPIPPNGYVLSATWGSGSTSARALAALKTGDTVRVTIPTDEGDLPLETAIARASRGWEVGSRCREIFFALGTSSSAAHGTMLGRFTVNYEDGTSETVPIRYGMEALPLQGYAFPLPKVGEVFLVFRRDTGDRLLVREWVNPKPDLRVRSVRFTPTVQGLQAELWIFGITCGTIADR